MRGITKLMINEWKMNKTDWMGYTLEKGEYFSYHHTVIPKCDNGPYSMENGSILIQTASHDYIHTICRYRRDLFNEITDILIEINTQHSMPTQEQLLQFKAILLEFERDFERETTNKGIKIIKPRYLRRPY